MKTLSAIIIIIFFSTAVFAQAGVLDSTFGGDGIVTTSFSPGFDEAHSVLIQPDGKIVTSGFAYDSIYENYQFALVRYNTNGTLDSSFGMDGRVTTAFDSVGGRIWSATIQVDGKIVVTGYSYDTWICFALARYSIDGSLDSAFGNNGMIKTQVGSNTCQAYSVNIQSDGKIVAAGYGYNSGQIDFALARYHTDGTLDNSFGADGKLTTTIGSSYDYAHSVLIQPDGKIVAVGDSYNGTGNDFALARYETDGTLDSSFGVGGKTTASIGLGFDFVFSGALQSDGKILAAGYSDNGNNVDFALSRFNSNGSLDNSFGINGKVTTGIDSSDDLAYSVAVESDGKIVVAGYSGSSNYDLHFTLIRYETDGTLDSSFGTNGIVFTTLSSNIARANAVAIQPDGKIVAAGYLRNGADDDFVVVRYLSDLALGEITFSSQSSPLIYPNPIHQTETLEYTLTQDEVLTLTLYDVNGREVKTFFTQQKRNAGSHKEQLNFGELPSGNYFLTLSNGGQKMTVKMVKQ